jgi:IS605 OrfB family transposase
VILTYRYRVKGTAAARSLEKQARAVNFVWNFCGDVQNHAQLWRKRWPSSFDLMKLTAGSSKELGLHSKTVEAVCHYFAFARAAARRRPRWRGKHSLGWVPFRHGATVRLDGDRVVLLGRHYRLWLSRPIGGEIKSGNFSQDARGRWYLNLQCEVAEGKRPCGEGEVGIDLGLTTLATLSTGEKIKNPRHVRRHELALARAQRARKRKRVQAIHAKIANCRRDYLHKATTRLVQENRLIVIGNVNAAKLARTRMAKSIFDAGWSMLRSQLRYKAIAHGVEYIEADERWTSQTCSACGARSGPKGRDGLSIREWACGECGVVHDRDVNSASLILGAERRPPIAGIAASAKALTGAFGS